MTAFPQRDDAFYRKLVDNASDLIFVVDAAGTLEYTSPSVQRVLGFAPHELIGKPGLLFLHLDDIAPTQEAIRQELAGKTTLWYLEIRVRAADGSWIPLEVKGRQDPESSAPRLIVHARDLRERLRIEQQLHDQYAWTRSLVEASPLATVTVDLSRSVTSWNPAAERLFGWTAQEMIGGPLPIIPDDAPEEMEWLMLTLTEGRSFTAYDTRRRRRDGRLVDVSVSLAPIRTADGVVTGAMKLIADISAQKALERQFRQVERMDATGRLAGGIAHDFNNLLGTIVTSAELLRSELDPGSPLHGDAEAILSTAHRANELIRQLLTLGRRKTPHTRRVELGAFLASLEAEARGAAPPRVRVTGSLTREGLHMIADPEQLREVIQNLVTNAFEAMPEGGTLDMVIESVTLHGDEAAAAHVHSGTYAVLSVSDSGVGMTPDVMARCFEPFFTTKQRRQNTGLGLATAHALARQLGGGLAVTSAAGIGTTLRLYLPLLRDETGAGRATPVRGTQRVVAETILLVEDDATFRAVVRRALTAQGHTVLDAGGGAEALLVVEQHPERIDLLVTDLVMPDIGGRELARRMRALRPGTPVLYMSGYTSDILRESGGLESSEAFIQKPFSPADFVGAVRGLFEMLA